MDGGKQPGPDHPISIELASKRVIVRIGDTALAESSNALVLQEANYPPVFYIPREDVAMAELTTSSTSTHCPYKGEASYFNTRDSGRADIAWSYEDPFEAMARIKGHLAFYSNQVDAIETVPKV
jgi:uncharacterized protein (DUF427 family)